MYKNNNGDAVKRLSKRALSASKSRNIVAVAAIILTTFMMTTVFSIGISFAENAAVMFNRIAGTTASIFLNDPTAEQIESIRAIKGIKTVGTQMNAGSVRQKNADGKSLSIALLNYSTEEWEKHIMPVIGDVTGEYPKGENDVMLSQRALEQLGIKDPAAGEKITLTYSCDGVRYTDEFTLTGWFTEYESTLSTGLALVSDSFCDAKGITVRDKGRACISVSRLNADDAYSTIKDSITEPGQDVSSFYSSSSSESTIGAAAAIVLMALFIFVSAYLLIYNIMYISVTKDINFYGLLKTIGTSKKQIMSVVRQQGLLLSAIGIPAGLLLGTFVSFVAVPAAMSVFSDGATQSAMPSDISFNPLIYIGSAAFSFATVMLSCLKPARLAGSASPVEAVRYTGVNEKLRKKDKRSTDGGKIRKMAFHNVFRDRKRAVLVFASLFMGTMTFLSVYSYFSSFGVENYLDEYYPDDFTYQSIPPLEEEKFDSEFIESVKATDGITSMETVRSAMAAMPFDAEKFDCVLRGTYDIYSRHEDLGTFEEYKTSIENYLLKEGYTTRVYSVDDKYIEEYNKTHDNAMDLDKWHSGEICVLPSSDYLLPLIGEKLNLTTAGGVYDITVAGVMPDESACDFSKYAYTVGYLEAVFVSQQAMDKISPDALINYVLINCDERYEPQVKAKLEGLNSGLVNKTFFYEAKSDVAEEFVSTMRTMKILTGGISLMLILIGLINFINVMLTGVFARRKELAVLESIGMTKKQIRSMLTCEGLYYALITSGLILTLGNLLLYCLSFGVKVVSYAVFAFPVVPMLFVIASLFVICLAVPPIVYGTSKNESVTVRLRSNE